MGLKEQEIIGQVRHALARDPKIDAPRISITMIEGQVALSGVLDTPEQVKRAAQVVHEVLPGIKVDNGLTTALSGTTHGWQDSSLNVTATEALEKARETIKARPVQAGVNVVNGIAHLHGTCSTAKDRKMLIEAVAAVPGIRTVSADDFEVAPFGTADDIRLGNLAEERLVREDPGLAGAVRVDVRSRSAHLTGRVRNEHVSRRAEEIVMEVPGIRRIYNELECYQAGDKSHGTAVMEQEIKHALGRAGLPAATIQVFVIPGVVTLNGEVATVNQKRQAIQVATRIAGTLFQVDNNLKIATHYGAASLPEGELAQHPGGHHPGVKNRPVIPLGPDQGDKPKHERTQPIEDRKPLT